MKLGVTVTVLALGLSAWTAHAAPTNMPGFALIPAGTFEMGDHHGFVDPKHGSDETPIHTVYLDAFHMGIYDVTTREYCEFLNAAMAQRMIEVQKGFVYLTASSNLLCDTRQSSPSSPLNWDGRKFSVLDKKENHPMVCVRWKGAAVYCNWLSTQKKLPSSYNTTTWDCDFNKSGFRLPTEAEWECAGRGGQQKPYYNYPWGDDTDPMKANVPESKNPFRTGPRLTAPPAGYQESDGPAGQAWRMGAYPQTTPVGFFNGKLQRKADFAWPGDAQTYQTANGANGYGLYDMAGNVWQWCNELYEKSYYAYCPATNPPGPAHGSPMPNGRTYHCMRGGSWFNGPFGHSRVSNRDPAYYRGPDPVTGLSDPDGPWFHIGFRLVLPVNAESRPVIAPTPARNSGNVGASLAGDSRKIDSRKPNGSFVLSSSAVTEGGTLPVEFTGDGASATLPLEWSGAPAGTKSYAIIMHHLDPEGKTKWYWILHHIPATVSNLAKNVKGVGILGNNSVNDRTEYAPPHSKGPGAKTYVYTLYALSAPPQLTVPHAEVNYEVMLAAMKNITLASVDLNVTYTRFAEGGTNEGAENPRPDQSDVRGDRSSRPQSPDSPREANRPGGGERRPGGGGGGGGRIAENNKTPVSLTPGQTVGMFLNSPKAFTGYTLIAPKHNTNIYLINNAGQIVHQWQSQFYPGQSVYLKPNGNLLHTCMTRNHSFTGGGEGGRIEEYDWNGKLIWQFWFSDEKQQQHHDIAPLPNGNILMLVVEKKSQAECIAAGFPERMLRDGELYPDSIVEIQPVYPNSAKVVWEWHVWDHLIQDFDKTKANYGEVAAHPELIYLGADRGAPAFWNHVNSIAYNAKLDLIAISARGNNEIWLIDHSTTTQQSSGHTGGKHGKGGDLIYRWGNPAAYKRGTMSDKQLVQQHDAQWIPDGYPGAGHITIFNNGYERGYSSIEEIVPPMDANGRYILESGKAYGPDKPVWHYEAKNRTDFFSSEISGAHRLPNGNTLVCAGVIGHLFEVTPAGEMVWQYVDPAVRGGILAQGELPGKDVRGHLFNAVFKAHRYAPDYTGLLGRDLTPKGVVELPAAQKGKTGLDQANAVSGERPIDPGGQRPSGDGRQKSKLDIVKELNYL